MFNFVTCGGHVQGADSASQLYEAGADLIIQNVTHIKVGKQAVQQQPKKLREVSFFVQ